MATPRIIENILQNKLSQQVKRFCEEYVVDYKYREAAVRAGYPLKSAHARGKDLYHNPYCRQYIEYLLECRIRANVVTAERIKTELADIAFCDITEIIQSMDSKGQIVIKNITELPRPLRAAIKSFKSTKRGVVIEFHNKLEAIEKLAKHLGFFEKDNQQQQQQVTFYMPDNGRDTVDGGDANVIPPLPSSTSS